MLQRNTLTSPGGKRGGSAKQQALHSRNRILPLKSGEVFVCAAAGAGLAAQITAKALSSLSCETHVRTPWGLFFQTVSGREKAGSRERFPSAFPAPARTCSSPGHRAVPPDTAPGRQQCPCSSTRWGGKAASRSSGQQTATQRWQTAAPLPPSRR